MPDVLFVSHSARLGGAELALAELVEGLIAAARIRPAVLLPSHGPLESRLQAAGVPVAVAGPYDWWLARRNGPLAFAVRTCRTVLAFPRWFRAAAGWSPDLVYTNSVVIPEGAVIARLLGVPHVWHVREIVGAASDLNGPLPASTILRAIARASDTVIAASDAVRGQFPRAVLGHVRTIRDTLPAPGRAVPVDPPAGPPTFAVIGSLAPVKGQDLAVEALARVRAGGLDARLVLVGDGDRRHVDTLNALVRARGLGTAVSLVGRRDDPWAGADGWTALVVPSRSEGYGRAAAEALLRGLPVVGTAAGATPELIGPSGGIVVPVGEPEALAQAMDALARDPGRGRALRAAARAAAPRLSGPSGAAAIAAVIEETLVRGDADA